MSHPPFTAVVETLPETVPFVGPEAIERRTGIRTRARIGANESGFGPSPRVIAALREAAPEVWTYQVSGKNVLRQWFSYRKKNRERPLIGDKRKPSPLGDIQPDHWLPEYTSELINVLNVLTLLVQLEPKQAALLKRVCDGPLISSSKLAP